MIDSSIISSLIQLNIFADFNECIISHTLFNILTVSIIIDSSCCVDSSCNILNLACV